MKEWPLLLTATALLIAGAAKAVHDGAMDVLAGSLLAAGLVCLGVWVERDRGE